jgi:hypothetical protein
LACADWGFVTTTSTKSIVNSASEKSVSMSANVAAGSGNVPTLVPSAGSPCVIRFWTVVAAVVLAI